jgi:predicted nucleic acid-binding protein
LEQWYEDDLLGSFGHANVLTVTKSIGDRRAALSARGPASGIQTFVIDGLLAATALEHDLTLGTRNVKDFEQLAVAPLNPWARRAKSMGPGRPLERLN